jgi:acetoacetyl-CoA synthetase
VHNRHSTGAVGVTQQGDLLWTPPANALERTVAGRYQRWLAEERGLAFDGYHDLWAWSVADLDGFWESIWTFFGVRSTTPYTAVLGRRDMPGAEWFPGATLNYAEHMMGADDGLDRLAAIGISQSRPRVELTFGELRDQVARARAGLQRLGVGRGDRVVAYLPNIPETLVAFLATASLGAIWSTCAPEFGVRSVVDRFAQVEAKVLLGVTGYRYGDQWADRREELDAIRAALRTVEHTVVVPYGGQGSTPADVTVWPDLLAESGPLEFDPVPFDHPLTILYSSGTTGLPKAIVHGHGGILLEHLKSTGLSWDLNPGDRAFWFTTTAWMLWNSLVSVLLHQATAVLCDGNPFHGRLDYLWRVADETESALLGVSPAAITAWRKAGLEPGRELSLAKLRQVGSSGSPLPVEGYEWLYEQVGEHVLVNSVSGGTDICSGIVGGAPTLPVWAGELSAPLLGVDAAAFDAHGEPVVGEVGELVIRQPLPSMPLCFWNDPGDRRYREAYFDMYPGVWRHGDWVVFTERGSAIITGRSDATLNRGGVRLGTGDFYAVLEELPEVADSLVVHPEDPDGGLGELVLLVVLAQGLELDEPLRERIAATIVAALSRRHVPDQIVAVSAIPRTLTGKKLEVPVKRILLGSAVEDVVKADALVDARALEAVVAYARSRNAAKEIHGR